jgi:hypothetical protein
MLSQHNYLIHTTNKARKQSTINQQKTMKGGNKAHEDQIKHQNNTEGKGT